MLPSMRLHTTLRVTHNGATKHKLTGYIIQQDYHLEQKDFLSNQEKRQEGPFSLLQFNLILEVLTTILVALWWA